MFNLNPFLDIAGQKKTSIIYTGSTQNVQHPMIQLEKLWSCMVVVDYRENQENP